MTKGKIKWFNDQKGYGFIEQEDGQDLFVHRNDLRDPQSYPPTFLPGDKVSYEIDERKGKKCAVEVTRIVEEGDNE